MIKICPQRPWGRAGIATRWLLATLLVSLAACSSPSLKLFANYSLATPPADIQLSRVLLVQVPGAYANGALDKLGSHVQDDGWLPWGGQVKAIVEDSLDKMQIEYATADLSYQGTADLPTLLDYAKDENARYTLLVESNVVASGDTGELTIEVINEVSVFDAIGGERVFFRAYRRKATEKNIAIDGFATLQLAAALVSSLTNRNLEQLWEDLAFELRIPEQPVKAAVETPGGGMPVEGAP